MRVQVTGLERVDLKKYIRRNHPGLKITATNPEVIICYGGDGTLLYAERHYPGKVKVMIRKSQVCDNCVAETKEKILTELEKRNYSVYKHNLLEATCGRRKIYGLNDILVGHERMNSALRFNVYLNGVQYGHEVLGDGILVSTPFGSTGYYQSITRSNFQEGLGIAFSNSVNVTDNLVVNNNTRIKIEITRGPGMLVQDNAKEMIDLEAGNVVNIRRSKKFARLAMIKGRGRKYNIGMSQNRVPLGYCQICGKEFTDYA